MCEITLRFARDKGTAAGFSSFIVNLIHRSPNAYANFTPSSAFHDFRKPLLCKHCEERIDV
jgi:hypothetical protein